MGSVVTGRVLNQVERSYVLEGVKSSSPFTGKQPFFHGNNSEPEDTVVIDLEPGEFFLSRTPNSKMLTHVGKKIAEHLTSKVANYATDNLEPTSGDMIMNKLISLRTNLIDHTLYSKSGEAHTGLQTEKLTGLDAKTLLIVADKSLELEIGRFIRLDHIDDSLLVSCSIDISINSAHPLYVVDLDKQSKLWDTYKNEWIGSE